MAGANCLYHVLWLTTGSVEGNVQLESSIVAGCRAKIYELSRDILPVGLSSLLLLRTIWIEGMTGTW